MAVLLLLTALH